MSSADALHALAARYTAAWCSQNAASVAAQALTFCRRDEPA